MVTIREVARRAGVSTATVSHVLNKTGQVRPRTRRSVLDAVRELGYVPNAHARRLASRRSRILGMIVSDIENPFFPEVIKSFETRARQHGYEVILSDTNYEPKLMKRALERMLEQKVHGVAIMTSESHKGLVQEMRRRSIGMTFLDLGRPGTYVSNIRIDYASGIRQVMEHLHMLGHRRIAFVGGRSALKSISLREKAYLDSVREFGLKAGPILRGNLRLDGGVAAGLSILNMETKPTAVVAVNDLTALGVIRAFAKNGIRVPGDISVTGFDRTHLAECVVPSLTTVDLHRELLGWLAADALHALSASELGREYSVHTDLVIGESTGPPTS